MSKDEVRGVVAKLAERILRCDPKDLTDGAHMKDDLGTDSILRMEFLVAIERHFKLKFNPEEAPTFETIGDVIQAVMRHPSRS